MGGKGAGVVGAKAALSGIVPNVSIVGVPVAGGGKEGVTIAGGLTGETVCVGGNAGGAEGVTVGFGSC